MHTILGYRTEKDFFDEFNKSLKKLFDDDFEAKTTTRDVTTTIDIKSANYDEFLTFTISPFCSNCGAAIISDIEYYPYKYELLKILDKCIKKCMCLLERYGAYYTLAYEDQYELYKDLKKIGFVEIGKRFTNSNTGNKIVTLRKVYVNRKYRW